MPLVRISARSTRDDAAIAAIGEAVHDALVETLSVPADDRFQIHDRLAPQRLIADPQYLGIERHDPVVVEVTLRAGRTPEVKRAFYRRLVELAEARAGIRPADVMIVLRENGLPDWSFGDGVAQYAPAPSGVIG